MSASDTDTIPVGPPASISPHSRWNVVPERAGVEGTGAGKMRWPAPPTPAGPASTSGDPTWKGTDHTREHIPVLVYGPQVKPGSYGHRDTFADIGQTLADYFGVSKMEYGKALF